MLVSIIPEVNCVSSIPPVRARASEERTPWAGGAANATNMLVKAGLLEAMLRGKEKVFCRRDAEIPLKTVDDIVAVVPSFRFGKVRLCYVDKRRMGCKGLSLNFSKSQDCNLVVSGEKKIQRGARTQLLSRKIREIEQTRCSLISTRNAIVSGNPHRPTMLL
jgi:hypothetical protein